MNRPQLILASSSIGRKTLLEKLGVPFEIIKSNINEDVIGGKAPEEKLLNRARAKAENIYQRLASSELASRKESPKRYTLNANYLVVAADSEAVLDGKTYGKAKDKEDAKRIISALMDKTHDFVTATCLVYVVNGKAKNRWENITKTHVSLRLLTNQSLTDYVNRYDFTRFAAGYALNETPWNLVTKIDGSYTNVVGLPFEVVLPIFKSLRLLPNLSSRT